MDLSLSVVIPYYNEPDWIATVVSDLMVSIQRAPFELREVLVVDDGSDEDGRNALQAVCAEYPMVAVERQANAGRFAARARGVEAVSGDLVLLLDSRVSIRADALAFVAREVERTGPAPVWTADVDQDLSGNLPARLVRLMEFLAWRDYMAHPRTMSYGVADFDRYPKGTTCFLAPRNILLEAITRFTTMYGDSREANDDTVLIRTIAEYAPINISPGYSCLYRPRRATRSFIRHTYHRGSVFVDGYGRRGTRFFPAIVGFYPASAAAAAFVLRRPRSLLVAAPLGLLLAATIGYRARGEPEDARAAAFVGPIWLLAYALGMWRGVRLALTNRLRRAREH